MLSFDDILQTAENTHSINAILAFLAADDSAIIGPARIDLVVHAGNAILATAQQACALAKQAGCPLLLSGGVGHSTTLLHKAVRAAGYSAVVQTQSRTEAESVGDIAVACWGLPPEQLMLETQSTNCGENAAFTRNKLAELGMAPSNIVVVQDPLIQFSTMVTFQKAWHESKQPPR
ncbi:YdcF family protein, partial [Acetobacter orientalis]|uniref:YdcF family protein n=1 Tax=Acetobacter orientalis TaxID=146474 RepID=UPI0039E788ED